MERHPVVTAAPSKSIWKGVNHDDFRQTVSRLQKATNDVPRDFTTYSEADWPRKAIDGSDARHCLPFAEEQTLADYLAFLAASEHEAQAVSAVAIEQLSLEDGASGLRIVLAANDGIPAKVRGAFEVIFRVLEQCASASRSLRASYLYLPYTFLFCASVVYQYSIWLSTIRVISSDVCPKTL
jgi:hypothetical protein